MQFISSNYHKVAHINFIKHRATELSQLTKQL